MSAVEITRDLPTVESFGEAFMWAYYSGTGRCTIAALDADTGKVFHFKGIHTETHDDGSTTVWIDIEER